MKNLEIAQIFREMAKILEIKGENVFRIRAYERAAQNLEGLTEAIENIAKKNKLQDIPGIGKDLSEKIKEFIQTGKIKYYLQLKKTLPEGLLALLNIPSVGPKTAKLLYEQLKIKSIADLQEAIKRGKLQGLFGIKEKTVANMLKGIEILKRGHERMTLAKALAVSEEFIIPLKKIPEVKKISVAGSLRRQKETVRDIDILVTAGNPGKVIQAFTGLAAVKDILAAGPTKSSVRTKDDTQIDCRLVEEKSFGAALLYFTGAKSFNIKLRQLAIKKGLKINEYGVFKKGRFIAGKTEQDIFKLLGMAYVEPELREDNGEIELALKNKLPLLIKEEDIKGDLHVHSLWSDGNNRIEDIARAAQTRGYAYIAITDHSEGLKVAGGLSPAELKKKKLEIEKISKKFPGLRILFASEVDIDNEGGLDYKDAILKDFDLVVAAIHSGFKQSKEQLTRRIVRACQNKFVHIIAHPTGRLWGTRDAYELELEEIFQAARQTNTYLEINAFPQRMDLNDLNCRRGKEAGVKLAISTDAHEISQLEAIKFGIAVARRGWLSPEDVINTLTAEQLLKAIKK